MECKSCPYVAADQQDLDDHIEAAEHDQDFGLESDRWQAESDQRWLESYAMTEVTE